MTDYGEFCHAAREWSRQCRAIRKAKDMKTAIEVLRREGIKYETRNGGYHFIIRTSQGTVNFYPTTGSYYCGYWTYRLSH